MQKSPCASRPSTGLRTGFPLCQRVMHIARNLLFPAVQKPLGRREPTPPLTRHPSWEGMEVVPLLGGVAEGRGGFLFASHVDKGGPRGICPTPAPQSERTAPPPAEQPLDLVALVIQLLVVLPGDSAVPFGRHHGREP